MLRIHVLKILDLKTLLAKTIKENKSIFVEKMNDLAIEDVIVHDESFFFTKSEY